MSARPRAAARTRVAARSAPAAVQMAAARTATPPATAAPAVTSRTTTALAAALTAALAVLLLAGCAAPRDAPPLTRPPANLVDDEVIAAVTSTVDEINATAGGPVDAQRAVLERVVTPDQAADQEKCPVARSTLAFDPAYRDLRPAPGGGAGEYLLPVYITIYTGGRITGSDLATVRFWVTDATARTAALCVS